MYKFFFALCFLNIQSSDLTLIGYKNFHIKSIKGQLSNEVGKILASKYCKDISPKDPKIEIEYEIYEHLDFIIVEVSMKLRKFTHSFKIKHSFSNKVDWKHDKEFFDKIAKEIYYHFQILRAHAISQKKSKY